MKIDHANTISIAEILSKLQLEPKRTGNNKLWYLSPLREEKTASFQVDLKTNRWYDFGEGIGGDLVNFVCAYLRESREGHTVSDALRWIGNMSNSGFQISPIHRYDPSLPDEPSLILKSNRPVQSKGLIHYLAKRGIPLDTASHYLRELRVQNTNTKKCFYALGFPNEDGGFELRNPFFKGCLRPKAITFIRGRKPKPDGIHLFEGGMDYLSLVSQLKHKTFEDDTIILHSTSMLKQAISYIQNYGYRFGYTWLDNDKTGEKATAALSEFFKTQEDLTHKPMNKIYAPHKDVNGWHMHKNNLVL